MFYKSVCMGDIVLSCIYAPQIIIFLGVEDKIWIFSK